ncbi:hypothetical protein GGR51DRAFT_536240 [Nemania sp. FL0031]|nr:hypothetical protein GGR51DRAFT_536240 [Nemania sp. FL0031]
MIGSLGLQLVLSCLITYLDTTYGTYPSTPAGSPTYVSILYGPYNYPMYHLYSLIQSDQRRESSPRKRRSQMMRSDGVPLLPAQTYPGRLFTFPTNQ